MRGDDRLHHQLALRVQHRYRDGALVDIETDILDAIHRVFLSSGLAYCFTQQPRPTSKGAPFYNAWLTQRSYTFEESTGGCSVPASFDRPGWGTHFMSIGRHRGGSIPPISLTASPHPARRSMRADAASSPAQPEHRSRGAEIPRTTIRY